MVVFALFNPSRYESSSVSKTYGGYNISKFKNYFREIIIIKHRDGEELIKVPMFFNGKINFFKELPLPVDNETIEKIYKKINEINQKNF